MDDTRDGGGEDVGSFSDFSGGLLNSIGSVNSNTTDLERIFTKEGLCAFCSSPLRIESENKFKIGYCSNKKCRKIFVNVVPTSNGMKIIDEMVEFRDIL